MTSSAAAPLRFLVFPSHGDVKEHVRGELLGRALTQKLGRPIVVEMALSYEEVELALMRNHVDLAWATAEQCNEFEPQARAVLRALRGGRWYYHAALICRASEPLTLADLRGRRAAWVSPRSTGGHLLPTRYLESQGLRPSEVFAEERFYGAYRKALQAVIAGRADMTAIFTSHPNENTARAIMASMVGADERWLTPFVFTEPTLADGLILTERLDEADAADLVSIFTSLGGGGPGLQPLLSLFNTEGFVLPPGPDARPHTIRPVRRAEYMAVELDAQERCERLWAPTGRAFNRDVRHGEGRPLSEVLGLEAGGPLLALVRAVRLGGGSRMEYPLEVGGETRWYTAEAVLRTSSPGEPDVGTALLVRDVTELRALEEPLYRLASFSVLHPDPMLELSIDGKLLYANPAAHTAFPDLLMSGVDHPLVEAALAWVRRGALPNEPPTTVHRANHYWEMTLAPLPDGDGMRVFARDVTARKQMEARLLQADRFTVLGSLAAAVGHEMNNPLAFLLANLSFAREELERMREQLRERKDSLTAEMSDVLEALGEAADGAERLRRIVQDLRTLSRAPPEGRARVDVHAVLENTLQLVRGELRHRARLEKELQPVPPVEADEARLGQVFLNLLINAIQAMSERDARRNVLRVTTRTGASGEVLVEVQDTGVGMAPDVLSRLFDPFFTTRPASMGLGLSVSHAIVTNLGGSLRAESQEGVGTTLIVSLPSAPPLPKKD